MATKLRDEGSLKLVPSIQEVAWLPIPSFCHCLLPAFTSRLQAPLVDSRRATLIFLDLAEMVP